MKVLSICASSCSLPPALQFVSKPCAWASKKKKREKKIWREGQRTVLHWKRDYLAKESGMFFSLLSACRPVFCRAALSERVRVSLTQIVGLHIYCWLIRSSMGCPTTAALPYRCVASQRCALAHDIHDVYGIKSRHCYDVYIMMCVCYVVCHRLWYLRDR